jgi:hypothetical protein
MMNVRQLRGYLVRFFGLFLRARRATKVDPLIAIRQE